MLGGGQTNSKRVKRKNYVRCTFIDRKREYLHFGRSELYFPSIHFLIYKNCNIKFTHDTERQLKGERQTRVNNFLYNGVHSHHF